MLCENVRFLFDDEVRNRYTGVIMSERKQRYTLSFRPSLIKRVDGIAKRWRLTRSETIERLCEDSVDQADTFLRFISDPIAGKAFIEAFGRPEVLHSLARAMEAEADPAQLRLFISAIETMQHQKPVDAVESVKRQKRGSK